MDKDTAREEMLLALSWVGNIKKEFQREHTKLARQGVRISSKWLWQSIVETEHLIRKRIKKLKAPPRL